MTEVDIRKATPYEAIIATVVSVAAIVGIFVYQVVAPAGLTTSTMASTAIALLWLVGAVMGLAAYRRGRSVGQILGCGFLMLFATMMIALDSGLLARYSFRSTHEPQGLKEMLLVLTPLLPGLYLVYRDRQLTRTKEIDRLAKNAVNMVNDLRAAEKGEESMSQMEMIEAIRTIEHNRLAADMDREDWYTALDITVDELLRWKRVAGWYRAPVSEVYED